MLRKTLLALLSLSALSAHAIEPVFQSDKISNVQSCFRAQFTNYDSWYAFVEQMNIKRRGAEAAKTSMKMFAKHFPRAKFDEFQQGFTCQTFNYDVDGVSVEGYVIAPHSDSPLPAVIFNRGGNGHYGQVHFTMMTSLLPLAQSGYIIVGSQYRNHRDRKGEASDEFGGEDVKDVVALANLIPSSNKVDTTKKVGIFGASRGGMQSFLALPELTNVGAVVVLGSPSDLHQQIGERPTMENVFKRRIPGYEEGDAEQRKALLDKRSVMHNLDKLPQDMPVLILHGELDERVDVKHATVLATALSARQQPHQLHIYEGGDHGLSKHRPKVMTQISEWFRQYL